MRGNDVRLLFTTRILRLFAYGFLSVVLILYLVEIGLSDNRIGLLLTLTLLGDTVISLFITTTADRAGRKHMLIAGSVLMVFAGVLFAFEQFSSVGARRNDRGYQSERERGRPISFDRTGGVI
jgi:MFS family permease